MVHVGGGQHGRQSAAAGRRRRTVCLRGGLVVPSPIVPATGACSSCDRAQYSRSNRGGQFLAPPADDGGSGRRSEIRCSSCRVEANGRCCTPRSLITSRNRLMHQVAHRARVGAGFPFAKLPDDARAIEQHDAPTQQQPAARARHLTLAERLTW